MDHKITNNELTEQDRTFPELHIEDQEDLPPIIINTVVPNDLLNQNTGAGNVPLFIKKLWKMISDDNAEEIISWNSNGDGFIIHDQLKFVSQTLPKYFKHNHLSSFVRQLNLYDFHKIQNVEKEEFQFSHPFFLKDVPQLLPLIKRKPSTGRQKATANISAEPAAEVQEVISAVKDIKTKNDTISNELTKLRRENAALWGEMNSLRVKYSKQTKIINKLIHFLISYMQKHHHARKSGRTVSTSNSNKYLKTGPKIMELDYRYKNNPHDFWTEFDNQQEHSEHGEQEAYTVDEPVESNMELESQTLSEDNVAQNMTVSSSIEELLPGSSAFNQASSSTVDPSLPQIDYSTSQPSSSKQTNSALQRAGGSKENLGYLIDNTQVEITRIKELLKALTPDDMASFYKLVNDNYKMQEDMPLDTNQEPENLENELITLAQMSPLNSLMQEQDLATPLETNDNVPVEVNENIQDVPLPPEAEEDIQKIASSLEALENRDLGTNQNAFSITQDQLLNQDDLLNSVSVDEFFN